MSLRILDALPDLSALRWPQYTDLHRYSRLPNPSLSAARPSDQLQSKLFNLPKEIRLIIWEFVLDCSKSAPPGPLFSGPRVERYLMEDPPGRRAHKNVAYPTTLLKTSLFALLDVCRTSRREALDLLTNEWKSPRLQQLDVDIMAKGFVLYPTWTHLPPVLASTLSVDLTVTLRIFSPESFLAPTGQPDRVGDGFRALMALLRQFVTNGPSFTSSFPTLGAPIPLNILAINIISLEIYNKSIMPGAILQIVRMCKALALRGYAFEHIKRIHITVKDSGDGATEGLKQREWRYEVSDGRNHARPPIHTSDPFEFAIFPDIARFMTPTELAEGMRMSST